MSKSSYMSLTEDEYKKLVLSRHPDCICVHNEACLYHRDIAELTPDLDARTTRVINRALSRQRTMFAEEFNKLEERVKRLEHLLEINQVQLVKYRG